MADPRLPQLGPWRAEALIGRGGTAYVYRSRHVDTGEIAAVKTVRLLDPRLMGSFRREVHALSRVSHPGVVRILDHGVQDGLPWYAMALVEGEPLLARRVAGDTFDDGDAWDDPDTQEAPDALPRDVLGVFVRLCDTLGVLHAAGLVHRDLKPANVIVADGRPVLVDFGLAAAARAGRESLEAMAGMSGGTAAYVAPEQILGEPADGRSDLYAIGCLLYEALTGQPPYIGPPRAVLEAHLRGRPAPPSALTSVPPELDALVMRLLARRPRDRVPYAHDVARALAPFAGVEPGPAPAPALNRAELVGREEALDQARRAALSGGFVALRGAEGVGKTRALVELARSLSREGAVVLVGSASRDEPLGVLREPLASFADRVRAGGVPAEVVAACAPVLAPYAPSLRASAAEALPRNEAVHRLYTSLSAAFGALGERVVLLLDDVHQADDLALGFLHREAARRASGAPGGRLAVVAAWRSDAQSPPLARLAEKAERIELGPLAPEEASRAAADMLGLGAPDAAVASAVGIAEGNPRRLVDALRLAVDEGRLTRDDDGWRDARPGAPWPGSAAEVVERRLARLSPGARATLEEAAVLGRADGELEVAHLDEAVRCGLIDADLSFTAEAIPAALVAALAPERRAGLHRWAADRSDGSARAAHLAAAGDRAARPALEAAAREAIAQGALDHAQRWFRLWLSLGEAAPADEARILDGLCHEVLRYTGHAREILPVQRRALALAETTDDAALRVRARLSVGRSLTELGDLDDAAEAMTVALAEAAAHDLDLTGSAWGMLGSVRRRQGRLEEAVRCIETGLALCEARGMATLAAQSRADLGGIHAVLGHQEQAMALFAAGAADIRAHGTPREVATHIANMAAYLVHWDRLDEALELQREALAIHRQTGGRISEAYVLIGMGGVHMTRRETEAALACLGEARALAEEAGDVRIVGAAALNQGITAREGGRIALAEAFLADARRALEAAGDRLSLGRCVCEEAHLALDRGLSADAALAEARGIVEGLGVRSGLLQGVIDGITKRMAE